MKLSSVQQNSTAMPVTIVKVFLCQGTRNQTFLCHESRCCEDDCCNFFYELWWFWLIWALILIIAFCCACHYVHSKQRLQQQRRQNEINLLAYRGVNDNSQPSLYHRCLPSYLLPAYEEVGNRPATPPPPYSENTAPNDAPPESQIAESPEVPNMSGTTEAIHSHTFTPSASDHTTPSRFRHFTGDSGIEVCDGPALWEQQCVLEKEEEVQPQAHQEELNEHLLHVNEAINSFQG